MPRAALRGTGRRPRGHADDLARTDPLVLVAGDRRAGRASDRRRPPLSLGTLGLGHRGAPAGGTPRRSTGSRTARAVPLGPRRPAGGSRRGTLARDAGAAVGVTGGGQHLARGDAAEEVDFLA